MAVRMHEMYVTRLTICFDMAELMGSFCNITMVCLILVQSQAIWVMFFGFKFWGWGSVFVFSFC